MRQQAGSLGCAAATEESGEIPWGVWAELAFARENRANTNR